ncbi:protein FAM53A [Sorex fumeus]|uniref:protein FAM53A n=1 Tax=Sorex fumeus TaxID=62283 RepID=UPI0024AE0A61|nr:protein FAM53A [Sorex fumeus]
MVTLITEKLQKQSLDDLAWSGHDADPCSAGTVSTGSHWLPLEISGQRPWTVTGGQTARHSSTLGPSLGAASASDLREHAGAPLAPPTKRHCRSLSEPDELARCRSPWRPGVSKVWTPVSKRRCHSGGSSMLQGSPAPRPSSASSSFLDGSCMEGDLAGRPAGPWVLSSRRRLSLSQEHLAGARPSSRSTPSPTPELGRRLGLLRSRSQPCALNGRKSHRKRRREEEARGPRPSLDFLKMTRTLKNSKSLCSLNYEDEDEDDTHAKAAMSSLRDPHNLATGLTCGCSPWALRALAGAEGGVLENWGSTGSEGVFSLDRGELDLEQIENN